MNDATRLEPLLVDLARNRRDEIAWSKLYKGIWGFVLAIVFRKVRGDGELAKEICQEVFLRLAQHCPFAKLQTSETFRAYVWRVAENECNRHFARKQLPLSNSDLPLQPDQTTADTSQIVEVGEIYDLVTADLLEIDRKILALTSEGHGAKHIAAELGMSESNVSVRLHRARQRLRNILKTHGLYS